MKELYNFDHRMPWPGKIALGPFMIDVTQEHIDNLKKLSRHGSQTFTGAESRVVVNNAPIHGDFVVTATVTLDEKAQDQSFLFPDELGSSAYFDLAILLSFLTGRRVYLPHERGDCGFNKYGEPIVSSRFFLEPITIWDKLPDVSRAGASAALCNVAMSYCACDLVGEAAYANGAFEAVVSQWAEANNKTTFPERGALRKCLKKAMLATERSLERRLLTIFFRLLKEERVSADVIESVRARVSRNFGPSLLDKQRDFLRHLEMYPSPESPDALKRLKWLIDLRNTIAHMGDIPHDPNYPWSKRAAIAASITALSVIVVRYYLGVALLKINSLELDRDLLHVKKFFSDGTFRGHRVFDESYEDFIARREQIWRDEGNLLG
jgi:hypothetical protein